MSISTKISHSPPFLHLTTPFLHPTKSFSLSNKSLFNNTRIMSTKQLHYSTPSVVSPQPLEELPPKLQQVIKHFQQIPEPKAKYEQLLLYGKNLNPLEPKHKTRENKVPACISQVWVRAHLDKDKKFVFEADADSLLTKGLAALLVQGFSGRPVEEIIRVSPDFVLLLGLQQSLTPSRNNGLLNMLKLLQEKAFQLHAEKISQVEDSNLALSVDGEVAFGSEEEMRDGSVLGSIWGGLRTLQQSLLHAARS